MADEKKPAAATTEQHSLINTTFPVFLPHISELHISKDDFRAHIRTLLPPAAHPLPIRAKQEACAAEESVKPSETLQPGPTDDTSPADEKVTPSETEGMKDAASAEENVKPSATPQSDPTNDTKSWAEIAAAKINAPFIDNLVKHKAAVPSLDSRDGKMLTENADMAYKTSGEALVDLFFELEDVISADRLKQVLEHAWADDAEATLKIIWNSRSIHLGKSSRTTFYRAVGWLAQEHPLTLVENLVWLVRPLIAKKAPSKEAKNELGGEGEMVKKEDVDSDFEMVEGEDDGDHKLEGEPQKKKLKLDEDDKLTEFDVKYGVSHGYWKDLLNILTLAAADQLKVDGSPKAVLNVEKPTEKKYKRDWTAGRKKAVTSERHDRAVEKLQNGKLYQALHLTVARLFADQLKTDLARLQSGMKAEVKLISLAGKWAPTHKGAHDQHTCIVSTIAELLHPFDSVCPEGVDPDDRELYLKYARIAYQSKTLSPLRKHLSIVERDITDETFSNIKYERVPSLAMKQYTRLFARKDFDHFDQYIENVASGKKKISGATLLPSTLVNVVMPNSFMGMTTKQHGADSMVEEKLRDIQARTVDAQWNTLVQRIKDSGTLESSIAVCDVSGSMSGPRFADGTTPMDSSIGLALLLAEVTEPPFGGAMITFSKRPQIIQAGGKDDKRTFEQKVTYISRADWGGNTDFVAVFEELILPMAVEHKLTQEQMVKQVFVFSDMQFDEAGGHGREDRWSTSYERIQKKFKEAGYEMPRLIFWNLAGGRAGYQQNGLTEYERAMAGDDAAPKPVTASEEGTALVSGYSQGMLKVFLDGGGFGEEEEEEVVEKVGEDGEVVVEKEKKKQNSMAVVRKAVGHEAYRMLRVVD
ncbi:uncharacterized protein LTR77_003315 [Saxophila tyrrhenica]|uniref:Uncharacterized protein n=1 Tax=Saxophila tyrrhenica TaxID=1690608 RepID=A0AAV9PLJ9_9PEZI|nr:hypothetical protein LTR77_003315 [Saxophila tyrrhenica]